MNLKLLIDDREPYSADMFGEINAEVKRLTIGDYAIMYGDQIILCAERKTLKDFSASLKDGRYLNKNGMIELRESSPTPIKLFYIVEGQAFPSPNKKIGGIIYKHIESAIFHLMYRDGFYFIYSKNLEHTAQQLTRLCLSLSRLDEFKQQPVGGGRDGLAQLTAKKKTNDVDIVRTMFSAFKGIGVVNAGALIDARISLADAIRPDFEASAAISHRGRMALTAAPPTAQILSRIPGISKKAAQTISNSLSLDDILQGDEKLLSLKNASGRRKLITGVAAKNIIKYLNWKLPPAAADQERA